MTKKPWYEDGLRFKCTGCGKCCTGSPGYVWLEEEDIDRFCKKLKLSRKEFLKKYTRQVYGRYSLLENPKTFDCVFFKEKRCTVYDARPKQCRKFPFWDSILQSKRSWQDARKTCEGIDHPEAPLISLGKIQE